MPSLSEIATQDRPTTEPVRVSNAGDKILISCSDASSVEAALARYLKRGSTLVTPLGQVGKTWVAACSIPPKGVDDTQTLNLADLEKPRASGAPDAPIDGCRVEELGFKRLVYGPSVAAVQLRLAYLKHFGGKLVGEIEPEGDEWVALCDMGDASNTGFRW